MAKQFEHVRVRNAETGKMETVVREVPKRRQGYDEYSSGTLREGLLSRLFRK